MLTVGAMQVLLMTEEIEREVLYRSHEEKYKEEFLGDQRRGL